MVLPPVLSTTWTEPPALAPMPRPVPVMGACGATVRLLFVTRTSAVPCCCTGTDVLVTRTSAVPSKPKRRGYTSGRTREWKKAVVQVRAGESIPIFQGLEAEL